MAPQRKAFPRLFSTRTDALRLTGDTVFLRSPERGDYEDWASLRARSRNFLAPWEPTWPVDALSRASFRARVARYAEDWRTDQAYNLFIFTHDETLIGGVGLSNLRRGVSETANLGYWIGEPFAFDRLRLHRVEAACLPNNIPSRSLLVRAGFRQEGYARQYLCIEGRWQDHLLFAMLREDSDGPDAAKVSRTASASGLSTET